MLAERTPAPEVPADPLPQPGMVLLDLVTGRRCSSVPTDLREVRDTEVAPHFGDHLDLAVRGDATRSQRSEVVVPARAAPPNRVSDHAIGALELAAERTLTDGPQRRWPGLPGTYWIVALHAQMFGTSVRDGKTVLRPRRQRGDGLIWLERRRPCTLQPSP